ncbi:MAG: translocation protein TolB, partial [Candidatus Angelobacter sp.]
MLNITKRHFALLFILLTLPFSQVVAQDQIKTGTNLGAPIRLAVPDFKQANTDPGNGPLLTAFDQTLWYDLDNAGIFDMVAKSFYPAGTPGAPNDIKLDTWSNPPANAAMLAFGNLGVASGKVDVQGWLYDVKNPGSPQVLGKQYREDATTDNARMIAHRFANEIITRLGGMPGVAESKIYFISRRTGHKEVWCMDYDGANQH